MAIQTLKLSGKDYVVIPAKDFRRMSDELARFQAEMKSDIAVATRRLKDRKDKAVPWEEAKKRLGLT